MKRFPIFFWPVVVMAVFFAISFFLSLAETALIALNKIRLRHMVEKGTKRATIVQALVTHLDRLITTILVGNTIVNIGISVIGTAIFIHVYGERAGMIISTLVVSFFILVFAEITPKMFAVQSPERVSLFVARPISLLIAILWPLATVFIALGKFFIRLIGGKPQQRAPLVTEEEIRLMIEVGKEDGAVSDEERRMLHRIFEFGDIEVGEVMVPAHKMAVVRIDAAPEELLDLMAEEGHARIPVYRGSRDDIIGIIYARDLLYIWHNKGLIIIQDLVQPAYFVKKDKKVSDVLRDFQRMKVQIAIVIDEGGKALGLVTLEDLIEEIVGELEEEHNHVNAGEKERG